MTALDVLLPTEHAPAICVVGAGIGGLALAHAWAMWPELKRWPLALIEQASTLSEVGAGIQLGPNVTRILKSWGLEAALKPHVCALEAIQTRNQQGQLVGELTLGPSFVQRYGAPYWTIHRGDLHQVLLQSLNARNSDWLHLGYELRSIQATPKGEALDLSFFDADKQTHEHRTQALIGADGVWSAVRRTHWPRSVWQDSGHVAYRAVLPMAQVSRMWHVPRTHVWMLPDMHVVAYPIQGGRSLNMVVLLECPNRSNHLNRQEAADWEEKPHTEILQTHLQGAVGRCPKDLRDLLASVPEWRVWPLVASHPLQEPLDMARGRVALLGDAAHPMLPYLAQGAGMAIEDADVLVRLAVQQVRNGGLEPITLFHRYAQLRWERCARVQRRAALNGRWFHASPPLSWVRDLGLRQAANRLMDQPWLYGAQGLLSTHGK